MGEASRLKQLLRDIGRASDDERQALFDHMGPERMRLLHLRGKALYDSENDQPGNLLYNPWGDDRDLFIGLTMLDDEVDRRA